MTVLADGVSSPAAQIALQLISAQILVAPSGIDPRVAFEHLDQLSTWGLDSLLFIEFEPGHPRQRLYDALWALQAEASDEFQALAAAEGIECLVFKGGALARRWFGMRALGAMTDIDMLVRRSDVVRIIPLLYKLGYAPGIFENGEYRLRDVQDIGAHEAEHYELSPYNRPVQLSLDPVTIAGCQDVCRPALFITPDKALARIEFDVHHSVASDVGPEDLFVRAVGPPEQRSLCDADHLWFGLSRLYTEVALYGKTSLRDLAYLGPLLTRGQIDWEIVLATASDYELRPALFYFLAVLDKLGCGCVPQGVLESLDPRLGLRHRDWGWQLGKLLDGIDPIPGLVEVPS